MMQPKNFLARIAFVLGCISFTTIALQPTAATETPSSSNTSTTSTTTAATTSPTASQPSSTTLATTISSSPSASTTTTTSSTPSAPATTNSLITTNSGQNSTTNTSLTPTVDPTTNTSLTPTVDPTTNNSGNITTSAGQWTLITPITGTVTPDSISLQTTLVNNQTSSSNLWGAAIGLSDNIASTPQYQLNIQCSGSQYNIFASKPGSSGATGPQGNITITQTSNPALWNSLENSWKTSPAGLQLTLQFQKVSGKQQQTLIILYIAGNPVWYWFDATPTLNMSRVYASSINCAQTFLNPIISSINRQTLFANTPGYFPLPTSQQVLITFQSSALPSNLCCCLYASPLDTPPTYEIALNVKMNSAEAGSQAGTHVALIHHTSQNEIDFASQGNLPAFSSNIPTSKGLYDILLPSSTVPLNSTQNYFLLYTPDASNNTIVFGTINGSGVQQPLLSWQNAASKNNNTRGADKVMSLCSISSNVVLKNITLVSSIANPPAWNGFMGYQTNGSSCTVSGLQQAVAYAPGSTDWASKNLVFPQSDLGALQFGLNLTQPSQYFVNSSIQTMRGPLSTGGITTSGNGAVVLFGTAPQGLPLYGITLDPLPSGTSFNSSNAVMNASSVQISAFSLASGTAQLIGTPVILQNTSVSNTYCIVYQKTNTADAAITVYNNPNSTTPLATLPIPQAATGIKYVALSCEQAPVTYNNITISAPTAAQTLQNNGTALAIFNTALNNSLGNTTSTGASTTDATATGTSTSNSNNETTSLTASTTTTSQNSESSSSNSVTSALSTSTSNSTTTTTPSTQPLISAPVASVTSQLTQLPIDGRATEANGLPSLSFKWGTTALNKVVNSTTGFSMNCSFDLTDNVDSQGTPLPSATLAIGLAPSTIDTTVQHQFDATIPVTTNGVTSYKTVSLTGFTGAAQLFLISIVPTPKTPNSNDITITQFLPSVNGANSQWVNQSVVSRAAQGGKIHSLWLSSAQTNTTQTITIGVDSELNTNPLYTWNTTKTPLFEQTCMSGWATTVIYKDIQIKPYTNAIPTYNWDLTKSSANTTGTLDPKGGGYLTAKVTVNQLSSRNTATFMIGFTSDTTNSVTAQDNGNKIFTGAEYNIQIQATSPGNGQPYGPAYVSIRRPTSLITPSIPSGSDSPYDGSLGEPQLIIPTPPALAFHSLAQSATTSGTPSYTTAKIWARYTPAIPTIPAVTGSPSGISRTFDVGIMDPNDTKSDINSLAPLWSWTETNVDPSRKPLQNVSLSAWGNTATITEINLVQNPQGTKITPMPNTPTIPNTINTSSDGTGITTATTPASAGQLILNGINTSANLPAASQWDLATQISPGTQHKFTITGGDPNAYAVFAFSQNGAYTSATMNPNSVSAHPILFTIIVSSTGIILNANGQLITSSLTGGLLSTAVPYWIQVDNSCFRIGGYASDNITPLITPYIQYPDAATLAAIQAATAGVTPTEGSAAIAPPAINFSTATTWFCAYQGFNNALLAYSGGERLKNQSGNINPAASILRSSMSRNAARVVSAQETARTAGILTKSGPTSNRQAMDRYTTNTKSTALSGPIAR